MKKWGSVLRTLLISGKEEWAEWTQAEETRVLYSQLCHRPPPSTHLPWLYDGEKATYMVYKGL